MLGIYIHIPFCIKKCNYCSFSSFEGKLALEDEYTERVIKEINSYEDEKVDTVYFGGGTPSLLKEDNLIKILNAVENRFSLQRGSEITFELNPKTADFKKLSALKRAGFNRISMGFQSFCDSELEILGRVHNSYDSKKAFLDARQAGFENISADIMFAIPNQNMKSLEKTLSEMLSLSPEHFSAYSLSVDEGTPFYDMDLELPDEDMEREMYYLICDTFKAAGYEHYEISNFAKKGYASRHNSKYWLGDDYIGIGFGAHSYYKNWRYSNEGGILDYSKGEMEFIDEAEKKREYYMLRLRMMAGIEKEDNPKIDALIKKGLLKEENGRICLTKRGIDVSNYVFAELTL